MLKNIRRAVEKAFVFEMLNRWAGPKPMVITYLEFTFEDEHF